MCFDPVSAVMFAMSAVKSVVEFQAQTSAADAQTDRYNRNYQNALAAGRDQHLQLTQRQLQEQQLTAQKVNRTVVEGAELTATANVNAASAGVSGLSVDNLIADVMRKVGANRVNIQRNADYTAQQLQAQQSAVVNQEEGRINSMAPGSRPSILEPALKIAGAGISNYGDNIRSWWSSSGSSSPSSDLPDPAAGAIY